MSRIFVYRLLVSLAILLALPAAVHAQEEEDDYPQEGVKEVIEVSVDTEHAEFLPIADSATQVQLLSRELPDTLARHYKEDEDFWYADSSFAQKKEPEKKQEKQSATTSEPAHWLKYLGWGIILLVFLFALVLFLRASQVGFARKSKKIKREAEELTLEEQLFDLDFPDAITTAENAQDWRLAVRLHYLAVLREMAERNIIQYSEHFSNADYLRQLSNTSYYDGFFRITREYEYCWYGKLDPGAKGYQTIKQHYQSFKSLFH